MPDTAHQQRKLRISDESGSMVIALLAVIVASGLMIALTASVVSGHKASGFDRDHTRVVQGADAGVQEAVYRMSHPDSAQRLTPPIALTAPQTLGDATYQYEVVSWPAEPGAWEIKSQGTLGGQTRNVRAIVSKNNPFRVAAFADSHLTFRGGNSANSYSASAWGTGLGNVGSNGTITMNGNATADGADIYDYADDPDPTRCTSNGNSVCGSFDSYDDPLDISSPAALEFIDQAILDYCPATPAAFTGTSLAASTTPYCFSTMTLGSNFTVTGAGTATVYLTGSGTTSSTFAVSNKVRVNCPTCSGTGGDRPDASKLQIFTRSTGPVRIGNHSHVAASIYAPRATCGGNYSNAGANFYGSLVCSVITNQGSWSFHYDQRLADIGVGDYRIDRWSEN